MHRPEYWLKQVQVSQGFCEHFRGMWLTAYHCSQFLTRHLLFRAGHCQVTDVQISQEVLCNKMKHSEECLAESDTQSLFMGKSVYEQPSSYFCEYRLQQNKWILLNPSGINDILFVSQGTYCCLFCKLINQNVLYWIFLW